ncbi:hypothetical protein H9L39_00207, partial [Fusarium oxysporum f. sp. albedinis]
MVPPASALDPTGYMPIETVADARAVITQCINGLLKLVPRGPDDREAAQFLRQNATFVFEVLDQVSGPPARRKSITIVVNGRRYCVIVICSSQNLTNPDLQPRHDNQYGRPDSPLSWPSELILPEFSMSLETCKTNLEASLAEMWRDCKDNKVSFTVFRYFERSEFPSLRRTGLFTTQKELIKEGGGEALLRGLSYRGRQV